MQRDFRLFWLGQTSSVFGSLFTTTATGLVAVRFLRATPTQTGILVAAASLLPLLLGLPVGALADRISRPRRVLIGCDLTGMTAVGLLACALWMHWATIWWLIALNVLLGGLTIVVETIYFLHLRGLVAADRLVIARARLQSGEYSAGVLARALAGPVVAVGGVAAAFVVDAVSYLVSASSLAGLRTPDTRSTGGGAGTRAVDLLAGLRLVTADRFLRPLLAYLAVQGLAGAAAGALTAQFLIRVLRLPTAIYGLPFVFVGVCGIAGSLAATRLIQRGLPARRLAVGGFVAGAASAALLPLAQGPVATAVVVAGLGIALPVFFGAIANVGITGVLTVEVPEHVLGRAIGSIQSLMMLVQVAGAVGGGVLGSQVGVHPALWLATGVSIAGLVLAVPLARASRLNPGQSAEPPAQEHAEAQA